MSGAVVPPLFAGICDDAAVFPPGLAALPDAVAAYLARRATGADGLVGTLVLAAADLPALAPLVPTGGPVPAVSVTVPDGPGGLATALDLAAAAPVELRAVEVPLPAGVAVDVAVTTLRDQLPRLDGAEAYVEIPRDERRAPLLAALAGTGLRAKLRTGGVRAELHPDETELAEALAAAVGHGLAVKATAGLHHAVRNTAADTGFEQHGFCNLLLAVDALLSADVRGGTADEAAALLAERDAAVVAGLLRGWDDDRARRAREVFTSFGTCSIADPTADLVGLGLLGPTDHAAAPDHQETSA